MLGVGIHYLVNPRKGECIFWTGVVEVGVIGTNKPFFIFLGDSYDIGQPFEVLGISDKTCRKELVNFLLNFFRTQGMETSQLL